MRAAPALSEAPRGTEVDSFLQIPLTCMKALLQRCDVRRATGVRCHADASFGVQRPSLGIPGRAACRSLRISKGRRIVPLQLRPRVRAWVHLTCAALWYVVGAPTGLRL